MGKIMSSEHVHGFVEACHEIESHLRFFQSSLTRDDERHDMRLYRSIADWVMDLRVAVSKNLPQPRVCAGCQRKFTWGERVDFVRSNGERRDVCPECHVGHTKDGIVDGLRKAYGGEDR
jgi:hypothetical protein